jgi:spore maturation protein CgeB
VLVAIPAFDYGDPARGASFDRSFFLPAIEGLVGECLLFDTDAAMRSKGSLDAALLATVERYRPDLVFYSTYEHDFSPDVWRAVALLAPTLAFFWDDQWRFADFSSRYADVFTYCATTEASVAPAYRALGGRPIVTGYAASPTSSGAGPVADDEAYRHDVSFVGGVNPWRAWLVRFLERHDIAVECFGAGWPRGRVGFEEMSDIFRTSRVNLNISNSRQMDTRYLLEDPRNFLSNRDMAKAHEQVKARHFEIAIAGGAQLSNYVVGLEDSLAIGPEIAIYATPDDCVTQVRRLLADPERRIAMAAAAWARSRREHTWTARFAAMLDAVWSGRA